MFVLKNAESSNAAVEMVWSMADIFNKFSDLIFKLSSELFLNYILFTIYIFG